jgi:hypothetical protein
MHLLHMQPARDGTTHRPSAPADSMRERNCSTPWSKPRMRSDHVTTWPSFWTKRPFVQPYMKTATWYRMPVSKTVTRNTGKQSATTRIMFSKQGTLVSKMRLSLPQVPIQLDLSRPRMGSGRDLMMTKKSSANCSQAYKFVHSLTARPSTRKSSCAWHGQP